MQPILQNATILLQPLVDEDFERLYAIANDELIWQQHPNPKRYQKQIFLNYFEGALASNGALIIIDKLLNEPIGCTRFYDWNEKTKSIFIGYTFFARKYWGGVYNLMVKTLMLNYIFQYVNEVYFHIGAKNIRSQLAIIRLGAIKVDEELITYHAEMPTLNFMYVIKKKDWVYLQLSQSQQHKIVWVFYSFYFF